jgi:hypothetical protein
MAQEAVGMGTEILQENFFGNVHLEDRGDERITLKWMLQRWAVIMKSIQNYVFLGL